MLLAGSTVGALAVFAVTGVFAATTIVVTPSNPQGFTTDDTRPGGAVAIIADATSPYPTGALQLTTDATTTSKAQYLKKDFVEPLSNVTELSYHTKQNSGPVHAGASYQLLVDLNEASAGGFTTFVYEPYQNGIVTNGNWQFWDVDAGSMWSSRSFTEGSCIVAAGFGGAPFYTLAGIQSMCPNAVVVGFGVNIGSNNPSYDVETDGVNYNGTTYDFELDPVATPSPTIAPTPTPFPVPTSKDACKKDGYKALTDGNGNPFKNQGQCVSYFNTL